VSTSALLLGVPYALAFAEEQGVMDYENEQKAREQGASVCIHFAGLYMRRLGHEGCANIEFRFLTLTLQRLGSWDS